MSKNSEQKSRRSNSFFRQKLDKLLGRASSRQKHTMESMPNLPPAFNLDEAKEEVELRRHGTIVPKIKLKKRTKER